MKILIVRQVNKKTSSSLFNSSISSGKSKILENIWSCLSWLLSSCTSIILYRWKYNFWTEFPRYNDYIFNSMFSHWAPRAIYCWLVINILIDKILKMCIGFSCFYKQWIESSLSIFTSAVVIAPWYVMLK